jgi:hypothetical protein
MKRTWQVFVAGLLCGVAFTAVAGAAWLRWKAPVHELSYLDAMWNPDGYSAQDENTYDACLITKGGNKVVCDAFMRVLRRYRRESMKKLAADGLAAGFSKCEIVKWGRENGFVASQMSEAVGMSLQDAAKCDAAWWLEDRLVSGTASADK